MLPLHRLLLQLAILIRNENKFVRIGFHDAINLIDSNRFGMTIFFLLLNHEPVFADLWSGP